MAVKNIKIKSVVVDMPKISIKRGKKKDEHREEKKTHVHKSK